MSRISVRPHKVFKAQRPLYEYEVRRDGGQVQLVPLDGVGKIVMPAASVSHFVADMEGRVEAPLTGRPEVDAVLLGHGEFLGKGDDGLAFFVAPSTLVKVSTTVPYQPENPGHLTPKASVERLRKQVQIGNRLADLGIAAAQRSAFVVSGEKGFQIKPWVEIPRRFTRAQLDEAQDAVIAIHRAGFGLYDSAQIGIDPSTRRVVLFDLGKAAPLPADDARRPAYDSRAQQEIRDLEWIYRENGHPFERRDYDSAERRWIDFKAKLGFLSQGADEKKRALLIRQARGLADQRKLSAHAALAGSSLSQTLARIDEETEEALFDLEA